jgi:non-specific serine/threonine protein kinase/serine/threonine-protein kinase
LGDCFVEVGQFEKALPLLTDLLDRRTKILGRDHPRTLVAINQLGGMYLKMEKVDRALELFQESLSLKQKKYGDDHPETRAAEGNLAVIYRQLGRLDLALPLMQKVLDSLKATMGENHPNTVAAHFNMAAILIADGKTDEALKAFEEFRAGFQSQSNNNRPLFASLSMTFSRRLFAVGEFLPAEEFLRDAVDIGLEFEPDAWTTFAAQALLGRVLLVKDEYEEADALLITGYDGMKSRIDSIPAEDRILLAETLDQLIALCEATENSEGAEKWREERNK